MLVPVMGRVGAVLLLSSTPLLSAVGEPAQNPQFTITSITVQGTNLVFRAAIPPGLERVVLEMRPALDARWEEATLLEVPSGGGETAFSIPRPESGAGFFRLKATGPLANSQAISSELQCVTVGPLASGPTEALFHFKGVVDGSDKILITHSGALWEHVNWGWPDGAVSVNNQRWNPSEKNYLTTVGAAKFLPEPFSLDSANLKVINARDVVALERTHQGLVVYLDDTPSGASDYEFEIRFSAGPPKIVRAERSASAHLKISAQIDGSERVKITTREASWEHKAYEYPANVSLNGVPWPVEQNSILKNEGTNTFLTSGVDFSTARIVGRKGRDLATMWAEADALWVCFADNPNGSDYYELEIAFGP